MQPDQAATLLESFLPSISMEWEITKKVFEAIPEGGPEYRPDPKARTASEIAWHIVSSEIWFLDGLSKGEFPMEEKQQPAEIKRIADMIAWYEESAPPAVERLRKMAPEDLAKPLSFFGLFNYPAVVYLGFLLSHTVHHRGQISTYLRPMGGKVPSIYGGSADEPFEMPD